MGEEADPELWFLPRQGWLQDAEPLQVEGRGVVWPALVAVSVFLVGLAMWRAVLMPPQAASDLDAMVGFERVERFRSERGAESDDKIWAASFSEEANYSGDARPLPAAQPGDWLYHYPEQGQTYEQFLIQSHNLRGPQRSVIYVVPLGALPRAADPVVKATTEFLATYYDTAARLLPVDVMPPRAYDRQRRQYDARKVLDHLAARLPDDALGLVGVTRDDLFIPPVNFVFGLGSFRQRVAVLSIHRYGEDFALEGRRGTVLRRSMTVAAHEFGHVLSMRHCTAFHCLMNGANSLEKADAHPMHLCPVCRRKAEYAIDWHRQDRYANLLAFYERYHFDAEADFVRRRLEPPTVEFLPDNALPERVPGFLREVPLDGPVEHTHAHVEE